MARAVRLRRVNLLGAGPSAALSLAVAVAAGELSVLGLAPPVVTAGATCAFAVGLAYLHLSHVNPGKGTRILALSACGLPALVLGSSLLAAAARLSVPLDLLTARVALTAAWWLVISLLSPTVIRHIGSPKLPTRVVVAASVPFWLVGILSAGLWAVGSSAGHTAKRFAFLFRLEDNSAWVDHAFSILRLGRLPNSALETEDPSYSSLSTMPGVVLQLGLKGRPLDHASAVFAAVDVAALNQLVAMVAAAASLWVLLLTALVMASREQRPEAAGSLAVLAPALSLVSVSLITATPLLAAGALSLAWAGIYFVLLLVAVHCSLAAPGKRSFAVAVGAVGVSAFGTGGSWPYVVATPILFGCLLAMPIATAATASDSPAWSQKRRSITALVITFAAILAAAPQIVSNIRGVGLDYLVVAQGSSASVEPVTLFVALGIGLVAALAAQRTGDRTTALAALLFAAAAFSATGVYGMSILPGDPPLYTLAKSRYVVMIVLPVVLTSLLAARVHAIRWQVALVGTMIVSTALTLTPSLASIAQLPDEYADPSSGYPAGPTAGGTPIPPMVIEPAAAGRILALAAENPDASRVMCRPSAQLNPYDNYVCNRWTAALSRAHGAQSFRFEVLAEAGDARAAWSRAKEQGLTDGAAIRDAGELLNGVCVPEISSRQGASAQEWVAVSRSTDLSRGDPRGEITAIHSCREGLTVVGWTYLPDKESQLRIWAEGPVDVTATYQFRPVDAESVSETPERRGFVVVMNPDVQEDMLCIVARGRAEKEWMVGGSNPRGCGTEVATVERR